MKNTILHEILNGKLDACIEIIKQKVLEKKRKTLIWYWI